MIKKTYPKIHIDLCLEDEIDDQGNITEKPILPIFKQLYDKYFKEFFNSSHVFKSELTEKLFHEFDILDRKALSILENSSYSLSVRVTPAFCMQLLMSAYISKYAVKVTTAIMSDAPSKYKFIENDSYKNTHEQLALLFQKAIQEYILSLVDQVLQEQKQVQENDIADEIDKTSKNAIQCVNKLVQLDEKLDSSDILADEIEKIQPNSRANRIKYKLDSVEQKLQKRHVQKQIMLHNAREKLNVDFPALDARKVNRKARARKLKKHIASAFDNALQNKANINDSFISQEISETSKAATHLAFSMSMIDTNMNSQDLVADEIEKIQPYVRANRIKSKLDSAEQRLKERYTQQKEIVHEANEKLNINLPVPAKHVLARKARMMKLKKYVVEHRDEITKKLASHIVERRMQTIREIKQEIKEVKKAVRETSSLLSKLLAMLQKIKSLIQAISAKIDRVRKTINNVVSTVKNKIASFFKKDKQESRSEITQDKQTKQNIQKRTTSIDDNSPST